MTERTRIPIAYRVLKSGEECWYLEHFSEEATKLLLEGYEPYGEPKIKQPPGSRFIQAFVKWEKANEESCEQR